MTLAFTPRQPSQREQRRQRAVVLADQARLWFEGPGREWRAGLSPAAQVAVATESLATTARLMALVAWCDGAGDVAFPQDGCAPLPTEHPLQGTRGGLIADASRALLGEVMR